MDAPLHFCKHKWSITDIPVTHFVNRKLAVIDVSQKVANDLDYEVTVEDLEEWEREHGPLPEGGVLFILTGKVECAILSPDQMLIKL